MTRDVQDYEAQARELWSAMRGANADPVRIIVAALRAEGKAALEQAAQVCRSMAERSRMTNPAAFDELLTADMQIRALIAPAPGSPPAPDPFEGHSEAEVYAALDEVRGKAPAADLRGLLMEARRFVSGERWATSAARRALIARIDAALSGTGATPSKEPPP